MKCSGDSDSGNLAVVVFSPLLFFVCVGFACPSAFNKVAFADVFMLQ